MSSCGHQLLLNFIDRVASSHPDLSFVDVPESARIAEEVWHVTFKDLARAIDKCAWWIQQTLVNRHDMTILAYIGPHDLRYLFLVLGACKAGHKV